MFKSWSFNNFLTCLSWTFNTGYPICDVHVFMTFPTGLPLPASRDSQRSPIQKTNTF